MPRQRRLIGLERVRQETVSARIDISLVNRPHLVGLGQVPQLKAFTGLNARALQLRAHRPIHEQNPAGTQRFQKT